MDCSVVSNEEDDGVEIPVPCELQTAPYHSLSLSLSYQTG